MGSSACCTQWHHQANGGTNVRTGGNVPMVPRLASVPQQMVTKRLCQVLDERAAVVDDLGPFQARRPSLFLGCWNGGRAARRTLHTLHDARCERSVQGGLGSTRLSG
jgi:hypothetical protein